MPWVNAGQGNMVYVPDPNQSRVVMKPSGPTEDLGGNFGQGYVSATTQANLSANVSPAVAAMASQEERGGVAGPNTATLTQMAKMQAQIDWLTAVVQKLIT